MANKKKCCKTCKEFVQVELGVQVPGGFFCTIQHALEFANKKVSSAKLRAKRVQHRADKERIKTKAEWLSDLQKLVNKYVRLRDIQDGCISCHMDKDYNGMWHASHYYSRGHSSALRFNLWNLHKSCAQCNMSKSGNIGEYTPRLIEKIGQVKYDWLTANKSKPTSYEIEYIKRAIKVARKAIKREERKCQI